MDFKLIISTFFVIFLAELGDKTQFAAMAASAGSNKPVSILIGAILALTISSVIAVAAGTVIGNLIPVRYIKIAAGILFIIFGLLYIRESFITNEIQREPAESCGVLENPIVKAAKAFENEEMNMLSAAKEKITESGCRAVIDGMIEQEKGHINILQSIAYEETPTFSEDFKDHQFLTETLSCSEEDNEILRNLYEREKAMAEFYRIMSEKNRIASAKSAFQKLYHEEKEHARKIKRLLAQS